MAINETLEEKLGTHEAVFYQLVNDDVSASTYATLIIRCSESIAIISCWLFPRTLTELRAVFT